MAALGLAVVLVAVFAVISVQSVLKIEDFTWTMSTVQDANGNVIACGSSNAIQYPDAEETSLSCQARKGVLTLVCGTEETAGTYRQTQQNPRWQALRDGGERAGLGLWCVRLHRLRYR